MTGAGLGGGDGQELIREGLDLPLDRGRIELAVGVGEDCFVFVGHCRMVDARRRGVVALSYFFMTFAPVLTFLISFCCGQK